MRRPLQALALMGPVVGGPAVDDGPLAMAAAALARLDREINGEARGGGCGRSIAARPLLEAARRRWRAAGGARRGDDRGLRWDAGEAAIEGNRVELAAALDNLISNALEHGGPRIELAADLVGDRLCLAVVDSGNGAGRRARERDASVRAACRRRRDGAPFGRLSGRARHGHRPAPGPPHRRGHGGAFALTR